MAIDPWPSQISPRKPLSTTYTQRQHISEEDIAAFVSNAVSCGERELIISHLADCSECRKLVAAVTLSFSAETDPCNQG